MPVTNEQVATLRTQLAGDFGTYERLLEELDQEEAATGYTALIAGAFFKASYRRFGKTPPVAEVVEFVSDLRSRSESLAEVDPHVAERVIRSVLGDGTISDLDDETRVGIQSILLAGLVADEEFGHAELDDFMTEARKIADHWLQ